MEIKIIDGFKIIPSENGPVLGIESDKLEACMDYAKKKKIDKIFLHSLDGHNFDNVDFLKENNFFTQISITDDTINISGIHYLHNLKYLSLSNGKQPLDLRKFKYLDECSIDWNNKIKGLDEPNNISRLSIWKFKPGSKDFTDLSGCKGVNYLHITESNIESVKGIKKFKSLDHFEGHYLTKLETLSGLEDLSSHLKVLVFDYCRKLTDYEPVLGKLTHLERLILGDCGQLNSIRFINKLKELNFFSFVNTNVVDGDISPAIGLGYVGFNDKKHYSHKSEAFNKK